MSSGIQIKQSFFLIPIIGAILFVALYIIATMYYPGGSHFDLKEEGFSWTKNYWCNLLYRHAINGQQNPAQPFALTGMGILCISLSVFWWQFPRSTTLSPSYQRFIQISGTAAMVVSFFLFTAYYHDFITYVASILGIFAVIGTYIGLYKTRWWFLFYFGIFNGFLIVSNYFIYNSDAFVHYLPVVQKVTFLTFLLWICLINAKMISKKNTA